MIEQVFQSKCKAYLFILLKILQGKPGSSSEITIYTNHNKPKMSWLKHSLVFLTN